jgi:hypothetical protein
LEILGKKVSDIVGDVQEIAGEVWNDVKDISARKGKLSQDQGREEYDSDLFENGTSVAYVKADTNSTRALRIHGRAVRFIEWETFRQLSPDHDNIQAKKEIERH